MVGTVFCVGVKSMYHSGIGGGGFMLVRASNGSYEFIDFRETAPAAAFESMYVGNVNGSLFGGLASGVPGELRGLERLHKDYGKLSWPTVMQPAINLARYGFIVNQDLVHYMQVGTAGYDNFLVNDPAWAIDFAPNGTLVKLGDTIYRKRYADTLETISAYGADAFYNGAIAKATIAAILAKNGTMTMQDLHNYSVAIRAPAELKYRDYTLRSCSAPSGGEVALAVMNIVSGYADLGWPETVNISTVRLVEAMKFAYGERTSLGDPSFVAGLNAFQQSILSASTGAKIRDRITGYALNLSAYDPAGLAALTDHGTSQVSTADASGMAVSLTTTVNLLFGSRIMVAETGVVLNDEMNDFSIPGSSNAFGFVPSAANLVRPGKRPLSSISPTIVEHAANGSLYFVVGAAGGSRIITSTLLQLWNVLDRNMSAYQAIAEPRFHDQLQPTRAEFEYAYNNDTVRFVKGREVNVTRAARSTDVESIRLLANGTFEAAGEPSLHDSGGAVV